MDKIEGKTLGNVWTELGWGAKEQVVKELVHYYAQLFDIEFTGIGSLYSNGSADSRHGEGKGRARTQYTLGPIPIEHHRLGHTPASNGPYRSTADWLHQRLSIAIAEQELYVASLTDREEDEGMEEQTGEATRLGRILMDILPVHIPSTDPVPGSTRIWHHDLHDDNILVNSDWARKVSTSSVSANGDQHSVSNGTPQSCSSSRSNETDQYEPEKSNGTHLTPEDETRPVIIGILDWEYVSIVPVWQSCQLPRLLQGPDLHVWPTPPLYPDVIGEAYLSDVHTCERTLLRRTFMEEMGRIRPAWLKVFRDNAFMRDFVRAVGWVEQGYIPFSSDELECLVEGRAFSREEGYLPWSWW